MGSLRELAHGYMFDMTGEVVLLTGAAGGIGRVLAAGFTAAGAEVAMTDVAEDDLRSAAAALPADRYRTYVTNLSSVANCESLVANVAGDFGHINVLVNCAATNARKPILEVTEDYDRIVDLNQKASFFLSKFVAAHMAGRHQTHPDENRAVLHVASINAKYGLQEVGPYGMSKAALRQLVMVQALEWKGYGIRSNALAPGFFNTPLTLPIQQDTTRMDWILGHTPLGRLGEPTELIPPSLLLASKAGSFINGTVLYVDGGFPESNWMEMRPH